MINYSDLHGDVIEIVASGLDLYGRKNGVDLHHKTHNQVNQILDNWKQRYISDPLFNQKVKTLSAVIMQAVRKRSEN